MTKSKDNRGNYAIGAQAKRADIDGVAIACDVSLPFGRGIDGALDLKVTKDRPGYVRALCPDAKTLGVANIRNGKDGSISVSISGGTVAIASADSRLELVSQFMEAHGSSEACAGIALPKSNAKDIKIERISLLNLPF